MWLNKNNLVNVQIFYKRNSVKSCKSKSIILWELTWNVLHNICTSICIHVWMYMFVGVTDTKALVSYCNPISGGNKLATLQLNLLSFHQKPPFYFSCYLLHTQNLFSMYINFICTLTLNYCKIKFHFILSFLI